MRGTKARNIIFDSTDLKVYGESEWKVKVHGKGKRRTWRKFHIGIDADTQDIPCVELTGSEKGDAAVAAHMLTDLPWGVKSARGDGAYDANRFRQMVHKKGSICIVPPPKDAIYNGQKDSGWEYERDGVIATVQGLSGGCSKKEAMEDLLGLLQEVAS